MARAAAVILTMAFVVFAVAQLGAATSTAEASDPRIYGNDATDSVTVLAQQAIAGSSTIDGRTNEPNDSPGAACPDWVDGICPRHVCIADKVSPQGGRLWMVAGGGFMDEIGWCDPSVEVKPIVTPGLVSRALRRVPLPPSVVTMQPPGGLAPVNFEVIFSTRAESIERTITLLGSRVNLQITPQSFRWSHGDGTEQVTDWAGQAWAQGLDMETYITHSYLTAEPVRTWVATTYGASYTVGGGPRTQVAGTVTVEGSPRPLEIVEAGANLSGD